MLPECFKLQCAELNVKREKSSSGFKNKHANTSFSSKSAENDKNKQGETVSSEPYTLDTIEG